jgi:outer membrane immunogenic protein
MIRALLMSSALAVICMGSALAADLPSAKGPPVYAPPPPPPPSWTGFYIGLNAGYGGDQVRFNHFSSGVLDNSGSLSSSGFLGGGTAGFNYQFPSTNYVVGVEGDFDGSTVRATDDSPFGVGGGAIPNDAKLDWFATARARFGYAFGDILPYVTGGGAFGHIDQYRAGGAGDPFGNFSVGSTQTGWTAGAGIEYQVTHNLTVKAEYLHVDLGRQFYQTPAELAFAPANDHSAHPTLNVVRAGVNWKFEWLTPPTPVVPKY